MKSLVLLGIAWLGLWTACAREGDRVDAGPATVGRSGPDTVSGRVRRAGNVPFVRTLVEAEEGSVAVVGEYEREVGRLVGATVQVTGRRAEGGLGPELQATSYQILGIDGEVPTIGRLRWGADGFRLETPDGHAVPLALVPEGLAELEGARIWVLLENGAVTRHGLLRPPEE